MLRKHHPPAPSKRSQSLVYERNLLLQKQERDRFTRNTLMVAQMTQSQASNCLLLDIKFQATQLRIIVLLGYQLMSPRI
jgi:hypothetical protein